MTDTTGLEIATKRFNLARRGYDRAEVDAYLADLVEEFTRRGIALRRAELRVEQLEAELEELRGRLDEPVDTLVAAVAAKGRILEEAARRAEAVLRDSYRRQLDDERADTYAIVDRMELLAVWDPDAEEPLIDDPETRYQHRSAHLPRLGPRSSGVLNDVADLRSRTRRRS